VGLGVLRVLLIVIFIYNILCFKRVFGILDVVFQQELCLLHGKH
jgi:hypothetical protein